jgi:hypothetical protein
MEMGSMVRPPPRERRSASAEQMWPRQREGQSRQQRSQQIRQNVSSLLTSETRSVAMWTAPQGLGRIYALDDGWQPRSYLIVRLPHSCSLCSIGAEAAYHLQMSKGGFGCPLSSPAFCTRAGYTRVAVVPKDDRPQILLGVW